MRTVTVKLTKPGHEAVATLRYEAESWPESVEWTGDRRAFDSPDGAPVKLACSLGWLDRIVPHQATQAGANWEISDDGGAV